VLADERLFAARPARTQSLARELVTTPRTAYLVAAKGQGIMPKPLLIGKVPPPPHPPTDTQGVNAYCTEHRRSTERVAAQARAL
jgi:hypothetical protein